MRLFYEFEAPKQLLNLFACQAGTVGEAGSTEDVEMIAI